MKTRKLRFKTITFEELSKCGIVRCLVCGKVLVSTYTHDFVSCGCENETYVDGGMEYTRIGGIDLSAIQTINCAKGITKEKAKQ